ncbi:MAG TPA: DUF58 domain-containing protein [Gammaproteobacteria bacterium]|nr:DUF58 domain-containing protein [Gammaproteobacteria bacterium]
MRSLAALRQRGQEWAARRISRRPGPVRVGRRHLYILPSGYGLVYALMLFVILLGAMNYSNSMSFAVCFLLGGLALVAMHHTHRNLLGLRVAFDGAAPVLAGQDAAFRMHLENPAGLHRVGITVESPVGSAEPLDLAPGGSAVATVRVHATRRGRLQAPRFALSTRQPLGLFHAWSWIDIEGECLVYPEPAVDAPPVRRGGATRDGEAGGRRRGREDFDGLRKYHPGDSFRHIAWKAVARQQDVMTKVFLDTSDRAHRLEWDSLPEFDPEQRLRILCRWILDCDTAGVDYGLELPGRAISVGRGPAQRERCLAALALFPAAEPG